MSKRATLTTRQKSIIRILTRMDGRPITVAVISEKLGVSTRTILREVPAIEKWMSDNDFNFERKPGVGMLVGEAPETLRFIEELLDADNLVPMYSRQERRKHILGELLFSDEPVKSLVFTSKYKISDGTLSEDLDVLDTWLRDHSVQIIRRPGLGIFVEGTELAIRQAISNAVLEFCDVERIPGLITQGTSDDEKMQSLSREPLLVFLTPQLLRFSIRILKETEARVNLGKQIESIVESAEKMAETDRQKSKAERVRNIRENRKSERDEIQKMEAFVAKQSGGGRKKQPESPQEEELSPIMRMIQEQVEEEIKDDALYSKCRVPGTGDTGISGESPD